MPPKKPQAPLKKSRPLTYYQMIIEMLKFLEVSIHTILFVRRVYPSELFARRKKYDAPVYQSRHPDLNKYISDAVKAVGDELTRGSVERVVIVIRDKDGVAMERFMFNFSGIPSIPQDADWQKWQSIETVMTAATLAQYFRSFLIRLELIEDQLGVIPPEEWDVTFAIVLEMKDGAVPADPINKPRAKEKLAPVWMPALVQNTTAGTTDEAENHMVRAVDTGLIN
ncbi:hypothetical protein FRB91_012027, partial [Serendipita sp. 411]